MSRFTLPVLLTIIVPLILAGTLLRFIDNFHLGHVVVGLIFVLELIALMYMGTSLAKPVCTTREIVAVFGLFGLFFFVLGPSIYEPVLTIRRVYNLFCIVSLVGLAAVNLIVLVRAVIFKSVIRDK